MTLPSPPAAAPPADPWADLRRHTPARIALGRAGSSLPTAELLRFAAAHAQARDAVHIALDTAALRQALATLGLAAPATLAVRSRASDRDSYLRRPDLGRRLHPDDAQRLQALAGRPAGLPDTPGAADGMGAVDGVGAVRGVGEVCAAAEAREASAVGTARPVDAVGAARPVDLALVLGDGLSALALQQHAAPLLAALMPLLAPGLVLAPLVIATQARVALADEIGALLQARLVLIVLGERPGLSAPDSLGAYLTHAPHIGCVDAQRNCVSNIRPAGLPLALAAQRLAWLVQAALRRRLTGVTLKDDSGTALLAGTTGL